MTAKYELQLSDARNAVWIHASDGSTVGRFGRQGVDLHNTVSEQMAGASECRLCTHGQVTVVEWEMFREKALEWWGVEVPRDAFDPSLFAEPKARIYASFVPQAWVNDNAIEVDALGDTRFDVTDHILSLGKKKALAIKDCDCPSDELRLLSTAPEWIREWDGPFSIFVKGSIADFYSGVSACETPA